MLVKFIYESDLLDSDAQVIAQQCNCVSKSAKGLSAAIIKKFPHANFYTSRTKPSTPGTIKMAGSKKKKQRLVLAMFAQYFPGKPQNEDTYEARKEWFQMCLNRIAKIKGLKSIAFPHGIGCGLAGGKWGDYEKMIVKWAETIPDVQIIIVSQGIQTSAPREYLYQKCKERMKEMSTKELQYLWGTFESMRRISIPSSSLEDEDKPSSSSEEDEGLSSEGEDKLSWYNFNLIDFTETNENLGGWSTFFNAITPQEEYTKLSDFLEEEGKEYVLYPPIEKVYTAFELCTYKRMKVVIIGQDPYHTPDAATGLAFSHHSERGKIQPSLRNIYKALQYDNFKVTFESGNIEKWARQGVFLINTALTVRQGEAGSHASKSAKNSGPWSWFMDQLFQHIAKKNKLVVIMWGAKAQAYAKYFSPDRHLLIKSPHPSPLSGRVKEFIESQPFTQTNRQLENWGLDTINWHLC